MKALFNKFSFAPSRLVCNSFLDDDDDGGSWSDLGQSLLGTAVDAGVAYAQAQGPRSGTSVPVYSGSLTPGPMQGSSQLILLGLVGVVLAFFFLRK